MRSFKENLKRKNSKLMRYCMAVRVCWSTISSWFIFHVVVVEKITRRIGDNYCRALFIEVLTASADSSRIGLSLVRDLLIAYYKCFVIHIGIGVWCRWVSWWEMCIVLLWNPVVVQVYSCFCWAHIFFDMLNFDVDKLFDAGAPGLWKGVVPDGSRWSSFSARSSQLFHVTQSSEGAAI